MTSSKQSPSANIQKLLREHIDAAPPNELAKAIEASSSGLDPLPGICKALGIPKKTADQLDALPSSESDAFMADLQRHILIKKISETINAAASLSLSADEIRSVGEEVAPRVKIEVRKTAELALAQIYAKHSEKIQIFMDNQPGLIESIKPEHGEVIVHLFSDKSLVAQAITPINANLSLRKELIAQADNLADLLSPTELATLRDAYVKGFRAVEATFDDKSSSPSPLSPKVLDLIDNELMDVLLTAKPPMTSIFSDGDGLVEGYKPYMDATSWKDGFSITVNGQDCASPRELHSSLQAAGIRTTLTAGLKPLGIEGALAKLRAAKSADASASPGPKP